MELWEPATRPQSAQPMVERREETVLLDSVSVVWVSPTPVVFQSSIPTSCRMSEESQTRVSLSNIWYSCLVGKVYWEDFNCFTTWVFTCFSCLCSRVIHVGNNSVQILNKTETKSCPSLQWMFPNTRPHPTWRVSKTRSLFLWWFDKIVWHMSLYCIFIAGL